MKKIRLILVCLMIGLFAQAQGPAPSYFYNSNTNLSWARCNILFSSGSTQKIPFLPIIDYFAPTGTKHYTKDVEVHCKINFIGNGIVNNEFDCYQDLNVENDAVLFYYGFPDSVHAQLEDTINLRSRIYNAFDKNVSTIIICMYKKETPFLAYQDSIIEEHGNIPIITINKDAAEDILLASGIRYGNMKSNWMKGDLPKSKKLITNLDLEIKGNFDRIDAEKGQLSFNGDHINKSAMLKLAALHDSSITFLLDLFKDEDPKWDKPNLYYFADYDSKVFYTRHWGHALSHITGNYYVFKDSYGSISEDPYGLAVHENTHMLFYKNWLGECKGANSFFFEGTAMYAQVMATDLNENNRKTYQYLKSGQLFPLSEMLEFNIGASGIKTDVGYPASGSLVQYLIETYTLKNFMVYWRTGDWEKAFNSNVDKIDKEWRGWLESNNKI